MRPKPIGPTSLPTSWGIFLLCWCASVGESFDILNTLEEGLVLLENGWYRCWSGKGYVWCGEEKGYSE